MPFNVWLVMFLFVYVSGVDLLDLLLVYSTRRLKVDVCSIYGVNQSEGGKSSDLFHVKMHGFLAGIGQETVHFLDLSTILTNVQELKENAPNPGAAKNRCIFFRFAISSPSPIYFR